MPLTILGCKDAMCQIDRERDLLKTMHKDEKDSHRHIRFKSKIFTVTWPCWVINAMITAVTLTLLAVFGMHRYITSKFFVLYLFQSVFMGIFWPVLSVFMSLKMFKWLLLTYILLCWADDIQQYAYCYLYTY